MWPNVHVLQMPEQAEMLRTVVGRVGMFGSVALFGWLAVLAGRRGTT